MTTDHQKTPAELADRELDTVSGGGVPWGPYVQSPPTGFGARTDFAIAQKQLLESHYRGAMVVPSLP
jgi:hypothetical protein